MKFALKYIFEVQTQKLKYWINFSKQPPKDLIIDTDHTVVMWYRSYRGHIFFRWLFLKDSFLAYVRPRDGIICDVMLMDKDFCVENGFGLTGAKHGLQIVNLNRSVDDLTRILPLNRSLIFNTCMNNSSFWEFYDNSCLNHILHKGPQAWSINAFWSEIFFFTISKLFNMSSFYVLKFYTY